MEDPNHAEEPCTEVVSEDGEVWLGTAELARIFKCSQASAQRYCREGLVPNVERSGRLGHFRVRASTLTIDVVWGVLAARRWPSIITVAQRLSDRMAAS